MRELKREKGRRSNWSQRPTDDKGKEGGRGERGGQIDHKGLTRVWNVNVNHSCAGCELIFMLKLKSDYYFCQL